MKQFIHLIIGLVSFTLTAQTKDNKHVFNVSLSELKLKSYPQDSTANALVLYEYGNSYVDDEKFDLVTKLKHKIKIFNKEGFDNANITMFLYRKNNNSFESIQDIIATTYTLENGEVLKTQLDKAHIYKTDYKENYIKVAFTLPNIKEGAVITYSYTLRSPYMGKYHGWEFQGDLPKLHSEYHTSIPANWKYHIKLIGAKKLDTNTNEIERNCLVMGNGASADCTNSTYVMKNIPAFIDEDYMTSRDNYLSRIEYELETFKGMEGSVKHYTKTWKDVDKELRGDLGKQLKKTVDVKTLLPKTITEETNTLKKAKLIYNFVQEQYTWNEDYGIYRNISVKDLIKNKTGNVTSINILLHNLLKQHEISVNPVILSTRRNGFATKLYPVITDFNYFIVQANIEGKDYFLDATNDYLPFGVLPFRCLNGYGRSIRFKDESKWVTIKAEKKSTIAYKINLNLDQTGTAKGHIKARYSGYHALSKKQNYFSNPEDYVDNLKNELPEADLSNYKTKTTTKTSDLFSEAFNIELALESIGDKIYFNPFLMLFFEENPFKLQSRSYPIDFGFKNKYTTSIQLNLDDNYEVVELPENINMAMPNDAGTIRLSSTSISKNIINILFDVSFNHFAYPPEYYPYLKTFMSEVINIQTNPLLVLKKKL